MKWLYKEDKTFYLSDIEKLECYNKCIVVHGDKVEKSSSILLSFLLIG